MNRKVRYIFLKGTFTILMIGSQSCNLPSQNYTVKTFTTKDGLANNYVRAIAEDRLDFFGFEHGMY